MADIEWQLTENDVALHSNGGGISSDDDRADDVNTELQQVAATSERRSTLELVREAQSLSSGMMDLPPPTPERVKIPANEDDDTSIDNPPAESSERRSTLEMLHEAQRLLVVQAT